MLIFFLLLYPGIIVCLNHCYFHLFIYRQHPKATPGHNRAMESNEGYVRGTNLDAASGGWSEAVWDVLLRLASTFFASYHPQ